MNTAELFAWLSMLFGASGAAMGGAAAGAPWWANALLAVAGFLAGFPVAALFLAIDRPRRRGTVRVRRDVVPVENRATDLAKWLALAAAGAYARLLVVALVTAAIFLASRWIVRFVNG